MAEAPVAGCQELVDEMRRYADSGGTSTKSFHSSTTMSTNVSQLLLFEPSHQRSSSEAMPPSSLVRADPATGTGMRINWELVTEAALATDRSSMQSAFRTAAASLHRLVAATGGLIPPNHRNRGSGSSECPASSLCELTSELELVLRTLFLWKRPNEVPSRVLRDLLATQGLEEAIGSDRLFFVRLLVGPPVGLNLRNIAWHGFIGAAECPGQYATLLKAVADDLRSLLPQDAPVYPLSSLAQFADSIPAESLLMGDGAPPTEAEWSAIAAMLHGSLFVIGGREEQILAGLRLLWQRNPSAGDIRGGLASVLPQLEHCLRRVFVSSNGCLPAAVLSPDFRSYYSTLDILLQENVVRRGDQLIASSNVAGVRLASPKFADVSPSPSVSPSPPSSSSPPSALPIPEIVSANGLRAAVGDGVLMLLHDLLIQPKGPRVRDLASHGVLDFATVPWSVIDWVLASVFSLCARFLPAGYSTVGLPDSVLGAARSVQVRAAVFHPTSVAASAVSRALSAIDSARSKVDAVLVSSPLCGDMADYCTHRRAVVLGDVSATSERLSRFAPPSARLCTLFCSGERISLVSLASQVAEESESIVAGLVDRLSSTWEKVAAGTAGRRAQNSLYKLCGCIDCFIDACATATATASLGMAVTDCKVPPEARVACSVVFAELRLCLEALEKAESKLQDLKWEDALSALASALCPVSVRLLDLTADTAEL